MLEIRSTYRSVRNSSRQNLRTNRESASCMVIETSTVTIQAPTLCFDTIVRCRNGIADTTVRTANISAEFLSLETARNKKREMSTENGVQIVPMDSSHDAPVKYGGQRQLVVIILYTPESSDREPQLSTTTSRSLLPPFRQIGRGGVEVEVVVVVVVVRGARLEQRSTQKDLCHRYLDRVRS